ncbi:amidohydrolase family protein [Amycolatopsis albispora]|uniref:Cytosine deaminase n=1 Tax=Amycolatopsis albispora TaxID=1804986 RepID=A0A344L2Z6_9PSEU|nr:amidohydrolase family protein [Amycolatopsis albispora]AXB42420.1 cytosine deaminase [Amycolatopsis albispora]
MNDLLLRSVTLPDGTAADLKITAGRITEVGRDLTADGPVEDCGGALVLPGLVDAHCHVDKTLWGGPWVPHSASGGLADVIANERRRRGELGIPSPVYIGALLDAMIANGTTHARSHVDVDPGVGLGGVEAVREALARRKGRIDVELVAFPQEGLLSKPGTLALLEEAVKSGVEHVGGLDPAGIDNDPVGQLDAVFGIADRHGCGVDIHLHDEGPLGAWQFDLIIERTRALGLTGKVTISHGFGLCGGIPERRQEQLVAAMAELGISLTTVAPVTRPAPPLRRMAAAGANLACGNDGVRDLWSPYGTGDMLERALFLAQGCGFRRDEDIELALDAATHGGARALRLDGYGLAEGCVADLCIVDARVPAEAVAVRPPRRLVVKGGVVVARDGRPT